jgi:hypothetical protein
METNIQDNLKILELVKFTESSTSSNPYSHYSQSANAVANENIKNFNNDILGASAPGTTNGHHHNHHHHGPFSYMNNPSTSSPFSHPASFLTSATSPSAVLAVSGISATNLLITSSGALGFSQIANLNAAVNTNLASGGVTGLNNTGNQTGGSISGSGLACTAVNASGLGGGLLDSLNTDSILHPSTSFIHTSTSIPIVNSAKTNTEGPNAYKSNIKALDFCYSDENQKFNCVDAINLCVTVVAYAAHAHRASQMLTILDVVIPRYLNHIKQETDTLVNSNKPTGFGSLIDKQATMHYHMDIVNQARNEFAALQKISVSIKTLVSVSDFLTRTYTGPRSENSNFNTQKTNNNNNSSPNPHTRNSSNRSPSIMPDEDSTR